ncbi:MAG TPA: DNA gyrase subunit B [Clostridia bacterium]|nr:DNA gyrase subunit B [Clostridia bacterium]
MTTKSGNEYLAKDIQVLEGLDAVRMRPGMYIGTTGAKGLHHLLWEIVDNAVDEAANGFADKITVTIHSDESVTVTDNGRGIPVDIHPHLKVSAVEVVYTQLHAGGKFSTKNYSYSGGLHGVGASVTNALSAWLEVYVCKDGWKYYQKFHSYMPEGGKKVKSGVPVEPLKKIEETSETGTSVTFLADETVFGKNCISMNLETVARRIRELAFLNKGTEFILTDERITEEETNDIWKRTYKYDGGLIDFVKSLNENKIPIHLTPIYGAAENDIMKLEFAIQYTNSYSENVFSYVNNIPTSEGGTHETGFKTALTKVMNDYARKKGFLKDKDENLMGEDYREGITAVLSVKMANVQFEGQTKTKLGNIEAKAASEQLVSDLLSKLLDSDTKTSEIVIKKSIASAKVRIAARNAKELARTKNTITNATLVGKLASCTGRDYSQNELFIVEGDSAGGTAKQARNRRFQAILPLRGKPLNSERKRVDQVLANEEIRTIISALDTSIGEDFDMTSLKYDKVIILSDADQDGAHIRAILLTFFFRYMKELITEGHVYIGLPPLYKVSKKDKILYAYDDNELSVVMNELGRNAELQRYKGLGEMNADQLKDTTMSPKSRKLLRVTLDDAAEADRMITMLMGDQVEARKNYIIEHADFNKDTDKTVDNYLG